LSEAEDIGRVLKDAEVDFLLSKATVTMKSPLENIEAGDFKIENAKEGDTLDIPRWAAEELAQLNIADLAEEPFEMEMYKALSREKMMGPFQLSKLPADFYVRMRRRLVYLRVGAEAGRVRKEDIERVRTSCYDLVGMRLGKLISLASTSTGMGDFAENITPEEKAFFGVSKSISKEWKEAILEGS